MKHSKEYYMNIILKLTLTRTAVEIPTTMWKYAKPIMMYLSELKETNIMYRYYFYFTNVKGLPGPRNFNHYFEAGKNIAQYVLLLDDEENKNLKKFARYYDRWEATPKYTINYTNKKIDGRGNVLYQIQAEKDIPVLFGTKQYTHRIVKKRQLGGYVMSEKNLSQKGFCWIDEDSSIYDDAIVSGDAYLENSRLHNQAKMQDYSVAKNSVFLNEAKADKTAYIYSSDIHNNAFISDDSEIIESHIYHDTEVYGNSYIHSCDIFDGIWIENSKLYGQRLEGNGKIKDEFLLPKSNL